MQKKSLQHHGVLVGDVFDTNRTVVGITVVDFHVLILSKVPGQERGGAPDRARSEEKTMIVFVYSFSSFSFWTQFWPSSWSSL